VKVHEKPLSIYSVSVLKYECGNAQLEAEALPIVPRGPVKLSIVMECCVVALY